MPNTLTAIAPVAYSAAITVESEPAGALESINWNFDNKGVAKGDSVVVPVVPVSSEGDYTPAMTTTIGSNKVAGSVSVSIDYSKETTRHLTGEEIRSLENGGNNTEWAKQWLLQSMRTLRNAAGVRLCDCIYQGASRAIGTPTVNPFATSVDILADARKELLDNGAPLADLQCVVNTTAGNGLRKLNIFQSADAAGSDVERRTGDFKEQFGFMIREDAGIALHTKGAGTGYDIVAGGEAVGQTTLSLENGTVNTTGIAAGDVVTFAGGAADTNKYVVNTGLTDTSGDIVIGNPGLLILKADADEMTIGANYTPNMAFERGAIVGVWRSPLVPESPIINQLLVTDNIGRSYLLCEIVGDGVKTWSLRVAYGFKVVQSQYIINIMG